MSDNAINLTAQNEAEETAVSWQQPPFLILLLLLILVAGAVGYWLNQALLPGENSVDVGFARDMSAHHAQAVEMASILYDRTEDQEMRFLTYDILTTQQGQIGIMTGWLDAWGRSVNNSGARMEWMGMSVNGLMPGMATQEEINALKEAEGVDADILFINLMIPHHQSGVAMANAAAEEAKTDFVRRMAESMATAQQYEIEYMQTLLEAKGGEPVPEMPAMEMEMDQ